MSTANRRNLLCEILSQTHEHDKLSLVTLKKNKGKRRIVQCQGGHNLRKIRPALLDKSPMIMVRDGKNECRTVNLDSIREVHVNGIRVDA